MPVLAVKSLDSSTSALAGSHAAQQSVSVLVCACADDAKASIAASQARAGPSCEFLHDRILLMMDSMVRRSQRGKR